ncbi:MAG: tetratricopeptide repeat protein [Alphaproteobacteria bacterium]
MFSTPVRAGCDQTTADRYGYKAALRDCISLADKGNPIAQYSVGWLYANGRGVEKDPAVSRRWYRKAAEQGNVDARNGLAVMYATGKGVRRDDRKAAHWYREGTEADCALAQVHLSELYANGLGVPQDKREAEKWQRKAAEQKPDLAKIVTSYREYVESGRNAAQRSSNASSPSSRRSPEPRPFGATLRRHPGGRFDALRQR